MERGEMKKRDELIDQLHADCDGQISRSAIRAGLTIPRAPMPAAEPELRTSGQISGPGGEMVGDR